MQMSDKVLPTRSATIPYSSGRPGELPQTTPPNPTQRSGPPPKIPEVQRRLGEISPIDYEKRRPF
jgi:hypothetical protein